MCISDYVQELCERKEDHCNFRSSKKISVKKVFLTSNSIESFLKTSSFSSKYLLPFSNFFSLATKEKKVKLHQ